jgi:hypothetical protein
MVLPGRSAASCHEQILRAGRCPSIAGFRIGRSKHLPNDLKIPSDFRAHSPNFRRRILRELRIIQITTVAASNPEMSWQDRVKPSRSSLDFGDGPGNVEGGGEYIHSVINRCACFRKAADAILT